MPHEFTIGDAGEQAEHEKEMQRMDGMVMPDEPNAITLKPGETKTLVWTFGKEPVVEFACHVLGQYASGMVGKIYVQKLNAKGLEIAPWNHSVKDVKANLDHSLNKKRKP